MHNISINTHLLSTVVMASQFDGHGELKIFVRQRFGLSSVESGHKDGDEFDSNTSEFPRATPLTYF